MPEKAAFFHSYSKLRPQLQRILIKADPDHATAGLFGQGAADRHFTGSLSL